MRKWRRHSECTTRPSVRQPRWRGFGANHGSIGVPRPVVDPRHHPGPHGIEYDIARQFQEVGIFLHQDGFVTPLEYLSDPTISAVDVLRENAIELAHASGKVPFNRLDPEMVVVAHQAIGVTRPTAQQASACKRDRLCLKRL